MRIRTTLIRLMLNQSTLLFCDAGDMWITWQPSWIVSKLDSLENHIEPLSKLHCGSTELLSLQDILSRQSSHY
jgi:hypothetical protein